MIVTSFGHGCFRFQSGEVSLLVNPSSNRLKADVTLRTLVPPNVEPAPDEIAFSGEYEVNRVEIQGWPIRGESTEKYLKSVFLVRWEDVRIGLLGHISALPPDDIIEALGHVEVLVLPVGEHFLSAGDAAKVARKLEPAVVIPSFAARPQEFLKSLGTKGETVDKLVFRKKELADVRGRVVILQENG